MGLAPKPEKPQIQFEPEQWEAIKTFAKRNGWSSPRKLVRDTILDLVEGKPRSKKPTR